VCRSFIGHHDFVTVTLYFESVLKTVFSTWVLEFTLEDYQIERGRVTWKDSSRDMDASETFYSRMATASWNLMTTGMLMMQFTS